MDQFLPLALRFSEKIQSRVENTPVGGLNQSRLGSTAIQFLD